ncbi:Di-copper centre-containing protein [Cadophora sp. DSE1049]|nr:Di-copper centre-containing protein [Cadophora sp. DSE1049]
MPFVSFRRSLTVFCAFFPHPSTAPPSSQQPYPSYDYGADPPRLPKRQSSEFFPITGVHTGSGVNGSVPLRIEVRELEKDPVAWTLYILGLDMLQYTPQSDSLSWYEIAGIHGRPFIPFGNIQPKQGNEQNGYCNHVSILFPTWHRPYLALYEQALHEKVQQIAEQYPQRPVRDQYMAAAANFRIPYWDWAASPAGGRTILPDSVKSPSVVINGPAGVQTIANPLYSYRFQPLDPVQLPDRPFNQFIETVRYPTKQDASATSQNNLIARQLDNSGASFRTRLYILLTMYSDYTTFSNEAWITDDNPAGFDSLESIHDQIHGLTGSGGHMTYIHYSAFDPLFWLHHAMIDRIFAMWQVIFPDSYVVPEPAIFNTFTVSAGQTQDVSSPLTPFHKDASGEFWTSETARTTETFGYAYPETAKYDGGNVTSQVILAVNKLYGSGGSLPTSKRASNVRTTDNEWIANIRVKKYALNEPFYVHIFIGSFDPDPFSWSFEPNLVGTHTIFVKAIGPNLTCHCDPEQLVTATIPLTDRLHVDIAGGSLKSLKPADVTSYLAKTLSYRVSLMNDTEVPNVAVPSLKISILSMDVERGVNDDELPVWGEMRGHMDVSMG